MSATQKTTTKKDFRRAGDFSIEEVARIMAISADLKAKLKRGEPTPLCAGMSMALLFEKPSLRTRATFDIGMFQLGGHSVYFAPSEISMGKRESVADVAHNLERWFDIVMARTFAQKTIDELADNMSIPLINALSDEEHPCQAMADYLTLAEKLGGVDNLRGRNLTYIGDGNNICHSLIAVGAKLGVNVTISSPEGYGPAQGVLDASAGDRESTGAAYAFSLDPHEAVASADAVYTDVWASMGQEDETAKRAKLFAAYQVNAALMSSAPDGALAMHDLPAHRGEEITDDVLDGPNSIAFDQAENRLHAQKGIIAFLLGVA